MKLKLFFIAFIFTATIFSQGIAVQGIARDNSDSAITNKNMTFTFVLVRGNSNIYSETESITTDGFGVFSHILGNGLTSDSPLSSIDFSAEVLKLKISVTIDGSTHEFFEKLLSSSPYAYHANYADRADSAATADNGVPTGAIMPFAGKKDEVPEGWLLCDGSTISSQYSDLRDMFSNNKTPDLGGTFLRGTGESSQSARHLGPDLNEFQMDTNRRHQHDSGSLRGDTTDKGKHKHTTLVQVDFGFGKDDDDKDKVYGDFNDPDEEDVEVDTNWGGEHVHDVDIDAGYTGSQGNEDEVRVASYGVNYIIKI